MLLEIMYRDMKKINLITIILGYLFFSLTQITHAQVTNELWKNISGEEYDYTKTLHPERVYMNAYHQMQVMKIMLSMPDGKGGTNVYYTFEQVLSVIKQLDAVSRGIPKLIFLVGWQYNGHDDKYPAWFEVNNALKRACDATGRESILWLAKEARKYNTQISVHVNMTDAYQESPLWNEYFNKGLISRNEDGTPLQIGVWNNLKAYQVCYKNEWNSGYAVKRINALLELLPFIQESGAIMIDAFFSRENPYEHISQEEEESYQRRIFRYFREKGIDVTHESFNRLREGKDHFIGVTPWFLWFDAMEADYMKYPAYLVTGGASYPFINQFPELAKELLQLGFLFGMSGRGEDCFGDINNNLMPVKDWLKKYRYQFYTGTLPYVYLNRYRRERLVGEENERIVYYNDNLISSLKDSTIVHHGRLLRDKNNIFMPAIWRAEREYIAYSVDGYKDKSWQLPPDWSDVYSVDIYRITSDGLFKKEVIICEEGKITFSLDPNEAISIFPSVGYHREIK